jgi:hypothetical protein
MRRGKERGVTSSEISLLFSSICSNLSVLLSQLCIIITFHLAHYHAHLFLVCYIRLRSTKSWRLWVSFFDHSKVEQVGRAARERPSTWQQRQDKRQDPPTYFSRQRFLYNLPPLSTLKFPLVIPRSARHGGPRHCRHDRTRTTAITPSDTTGAMPYDTAITLSSEDDITDTARETM